VAKPEFNFMFMQSNELLAKKFEHPKIKKLVELIKKEKAKNKKAKILVMFMALTIIGMLIYLIIATNNLDGPEVEDFGNVQKRTILTLNKKMPYYFMLIVLQSLQKKKFLRLN